MGQFIRNVFASCFGVLVALGLIVVVSMIIFGNILTSASTPPKVKPNSVLYLDFLDEIPDRTNNTSNNSTLSLKEEKILGLQEIIRTIENAKEDDNIKGIFLEPEWINAGFASANSLRRALMDFKSEGKFVISYGKYFTQGTYFIASAADKIYLNPVGIVDFRGFSADIAYYKDLLDKVGVKMEVFYAGKFKSATEPYRRTSMSEENRTQLRAFLNDRYNNYLNQLSDSRNLSIASLRQAADEFTGGEPSTALSSGLVDAVAHRDEALTEIRSLVGIDENDKLRFVNLTEYNLSNPPKINFKSDNKIAIVYAEGTIIDGEGQNGSTGDSKYTRIIRKIRNDKRVKALVLRVNSPGGSAMASEAIWRELELTKAKGIPVIVSMGDYAASGGYYISAPADVIVAQPNTLTGSIGVFSMFPNISKLMNEKLGVSFDTVKTSEMSTAFLPVFDLSEREAKYFQSRTDSLYAKFLGRVAQGRDMTVDAVNEIAQGRVWTGTKAKEIGLVDQLGDLKDAITVAAEEAGLNDYRLSEYPKVKNQYEQLLDELMGGKKEIMSAKQLIKEELGEYYPYYEVLNEIKSSKGPQMRLPFIISFH